VNGNTESESLNVFLKIKQTPMNFNSFSGNNHYVTLSGFFSQ